MNLRNVRRAMTVVLDSNEALFPVSVAVAITVSDLGAAGLTALRLFLFFKHLAGQREEDLIELRLTQRHVVKGDVQGFQVLERIAKQLENAFNAERHASR